MPRVSVAIPCYQYGSYMEECLDSVLSQDLRDVEVLIADNASTDATPDIGRRYARADGRVRYHRQDTNVGYARNVNWLFRQATGDFVTVLACDDRYLGPGFLRSSVERLERTGAVFVHGAYDDVDDAGHHLRTVRRHEHAFTRPGREELLHYLVLRCPWISSVVARRDVVERVHGFDLDHEFACDLGWFMHMALEGSVAYSPASLVTHRHHAASITATVHERRKLRHYEALLASLRPRLEGDAELIEAWRRGVRIVADGLREPEQETDVAGRLEGLAHAWRARGARVLVYGAGMHTRDLLGRGHLSGVDVVAFADADPAYAGTVLEGRPIVAPAAIEGTGADVVLISSRRYEAEIQDQLRASLPATIEIERIYGSTASLRATGS